MIEKVRLAKRPQHEFKTKRPNLLVVKIANGVGAQQVTLNDIGLVDEFSNSLMFRPTSRVTKDNKHLLEFSKSRGNTVTFDVSQTPVIKQYKHCQVNVFGVNKLGTLYTKTVFDDYEEEID